MSRYSSKIGGMSNNYGVGIITENKIVIALRDQGNKIRTIEKEYHITKNTIWSKIPFLRVFILFKQIWSIWKIFRKELLFLQKSGIIFDRKKRYKHVFFSFLGVYLVFIIFSLLLNYFFEYLYPSIFLERISLIILLVFFVILFIRLVIGKQSLRYHAAEHQAINAYLHKSSLNIKNLQKFPKESYRCGTSLIWIVILLQAIFYDNWIFKLNYGNILIIILASIIETLILLSISYEIILFLDKYHDYKIVKILLYPAIFLQKFSTLKATKNELEVALKAIRKI